MKNILVSLLTIASLGTATIAMAQTSSAVTATCKDGTTFTGASRQGACGGHGGVQTFTSPATQSTTKAIAPTQAPTTATTAPSTQTAPKPPAKMTMPSTAASKATAGQVWVNSATKVYHCPGDRYYGKTKQGSYMSESSAKAEGDRPDHNKTCS